MRTVEIDCTTGEATVRPATTGEAEQIERDRADTEARDAESAARPDPDAEFRAALTAATTVAQLRDALLGNAGPGAQARRPDSR